MNHDIEQLIHDVMHGQATDQDRQRLSDWIVASPDNARAYYRVVLDERAIHRVLEHDSTRAVSHLSDNPDDSGTGLLLAELARAEAAVHAPLVELVQIKPRWRDRVSPGYAWAAVVAFAALAGLMSILLMQPGQYQSSSPISAQPPSTPFDAKDLPYVATLTAQRNAQWANTPLRTQDRLRAGQTLTLTSGLAELTTQRGAVALIQGPCTIELIDHDNALRLHQGKLFGIVHSESAKGFTVHAPHMDVIDLGTRFGIDATDTDETQVHVLEGEVEISRRSLTGQALSRLTLTQGQAAIAKADQSVVQRIAAQPQRFASIAPQTIQLPGTGQGLSIGEIDPNWQVVSVNGQTLKTPVYMKVGNALRIGEGRAQRVSADTYWLSDNTHYPNRTDPETKLTCRTVFDVPAGVDLKQAVLSMAFGADDRIVQVRVNGNAYTPPTNSWTGGNDATYTMRIEEALVTGTNTVEFDIVDLARLGNTLWGLGIDWHLEVGATATP